MKRTRTFHLLTLLASISLSGLVHAQVPGISARVEHPINSATQAEFDRRVLASGTQSSVDKLAEGEGSGNSVPRTGTSAQPAPSIAANHGEPRSPTVGSATHPPEIAQLTATQGPRSGSRIPVLLAWNGFFPGSSRPLLQMARAGGSFQDLVPINSEDQTYSHWIETRDGWDWKATLSFRLKATVDTGSIFSPIATLSLRPEDPEPPTGLILTWTDETLNLSFTQPSSCQSGDQDGVEAATAGSQTFRPIKTLTRDCSKPWVNLPLPELSQADQVPASVRIKSTNALGVESPYSTTVVYRGLSDPVPPAPTGLVLTPVKTSESDPAPESVVLSWLWTPGSPPTSLSGFLIEQAIASSDGAPAPANDQFKTVLSTLPSLRSSTVLTMSASKPGQTYWYRVRALAGAKPSVPSTAVSFQVPQVTPEQIAGLQVWVKSDTGTLDQAGSPVATGGRVATWKDQSGNGNDFIIPVPVAGPALQGPSLTAPVLAGHPALRFSGRYFGLANKTFGLGSGATVFIVFSFVPGSNVQQFVSQGTTGFWWQSLAPQHLAVHSAGPNFFIPSSASTANAHLWTLVFGRAGLLAQDGTSLKTTNMSPDASPAPLGLGAGGGSFSNSFTGDIFEVVIFSGILSDSDRRAVEGYLNSKYNLF